MDTEFEKVKEPIPLVEVNTTAAREHVGVIESNIRHMKEKVRATTSEYPFVWIPIMVLIHAVYYCIFLAKRISKLFGELWLLAT